MGGAGGSKAYLPSFSVDYGSDQYKDNYDETFGPRADTTYCECGHRERMPDELSRTWRCAKCWSVLEPM